MHRQELEALNALAIAHQRAGVHFLSLPADNVKSTEGVLGRMSGSQIMDFEGCAISLIGHGAVTS